MEGVTTVEAEIEDQGQEIVVVVLAHDLVPDHVIVVHLVIAIVAAEETLARRAGAEALLSPETTRGRSPGLQPRAHLDQEVGLDLDPKARDSILLIPSQ